MEAPTIGVRVDVRAPLCGWWRKNWGGRYACNQYMLISGMLVTRLLFFIIIKNSFNLMYMGIPYGDLWYAAGNRDGFRFGLVNRPSPPLSIYPLISTLDWCLH